VPIRPEQISSPVRASSIQQRGSDTTIELYNENTVTTITIGGGSGLTTLTLGSAGSVLTLTDVVDIAGRGSAPGLAPAGTARYYFDTGTNKLRLSENGGAYVDFSGGGGSQGLDDVLAVDPNTGANDITVASGQVIEGASELTLRANPGSTLRLQAGALLDTHIFSLQSGNREFAATPGGQMVIHAGDADMADTGGETLLLRAGNANGIGPGGSLDIQAGAVDTDGMGGSITFTATDSAGVNGAGGITFNAGNGYGAGDISLNTQIGGPGGPGDINLNSAGDVNITGDTITFSGTVSGNFAASQIQAGSGEDLTFGADATDFWQILSDGSLRALDASYLLQVSTITPNASTSLHILNNGGGGTELLLESDGTQPITMRVNAIDYWQVTGLGRLHGVATGNEIGIAQGGATDNGGDLVVGAGPGGATSGDGGDLLLDGGTVTSGTAGSVTLRTAGTARWTINASGHFVPSADDTYDIGTTSVRVRSIYIDTSIDLDAANLVTDTTTGTQIATGATQKLGFFGAAPVVQQVVSGARDDPEAALANLLTALDVLGLIDDQTTAT